MKSKSKIGKEKEWSYFYDAIEGFDYEPGYVYKLKVERIKRNGTVRAHASAYTYKLRKLVSKKKAKSSEAGTEASYIDKKMIIEKLKKGER